MAIKVVAISDVAEFLGVSKKTIINRNRSLKYSDCFVYLKQPINNKHIFYKLSCIEMEINCIVLDEKTINEYMSAYYKLVEIILKKVFNIETNEGLDDEIYDKVDNFIYTAFVKDGYNIFFKVIEQIAKRYPIKHEIFKEIIKDVKLPYNNKLLVKQFIMFYKTLYEKLENN